jgi:hypothetical protein
MNDDWSDKLNLETLDWKENFSKNLVICYNKKGYELAIELSNKMDFLYINIFTGVLNSIIDIDILIKYCSLEKFSKTFVSKLLTQKTKKSFDERIASAFLTKFDFFANEIQKSYDCLEIEFKDKRKQF